MHMIWNVEYGFFLIKILDIFSFWIPAAAKDKVPIYHRGTAVAYSEMKTIPLDLNRDFIRLQLQIIFFFVLCILPCTICLRYHLYHVLCIVRKYFFSFLYKVETTALIAICLKATYQFDRSVKFHILHFKVSSFFYLKTLY